VKLATTRMTISLSLFPPPPPKHRLCSYQRVLLGIEGDSHRNPFASKTFCFICMLKMYHLFCCNTPPHIRTSRGLGERTISIRNVKPRPKTRTQNSRILSQFRICHNSRGDCYKQVQHLQDVCFQNFEVYFFIVPCSKS